MIRFLLEGFERNCSKEAIVWRGQSFTYDWLLKRISHWRQVIHEQAVSPGAVVSLEADFSPNGVALFFALAEHRCVLVPLTSSVEGKKHEFLATAEAEWSIGLDSQDGVSLIHRDCTASHLFYQRLREMQHAGLVLFSSGSTGKSKAAVHDLKGLLDKFTVPRKCVRAITFLLYDHIGGVNTMLYVLSNGGCMITVPDRSPDGVLTAVEQHRAELLPTSPTFINLILLSEAYKRHDLSSLQLVTYGTEPMPQSTLQRFHELFPTITVQQTYGLSEVGILRSKSRSSNSLWVKVGGEGFQTRVVDGILHIKANSAMLGYLNAASPFTEDGWFNTGDMVEVDGEYFRILGRKSEMINVGGEKVFPSDVESVIQELSNVAEVTVYGEQNAITGNIVCARVRLIAEEPRGDFVARLKHHCRQRLRPAQVPVRVLIDEQSQHTSRFKKARFREA